MTNEESIKVLKGCTIYANGKASHEALDVAIEALEQAEKYRWHDLINNPNDLPQDLHLVEICIRGFEGFNAGILLAIHNKNKRLWGTESFKFNESDVIAWREIKPFKRG